MVPYPMIRSLGRQRERERERDTAVARIPISSSSPFPSSCHHTFRDLPSQPTHAKYIGLHRAFFLKLVRLHVFYLLGTYLFASVRLMITLALTYNPFCIVPFQSHSYSLTHSLTHPGLDTVNNLKAAI